MDKVQWFVIKLVGHSKIVVLSKLFDDKKDAMAFYNSLHSRGGVLVVETIYG